MDTHTGTPPPPPLSLLAGIIKTGCFTGNARSRISPRLRQHFLYSQYKQQFPSSLRELTTHVKLILSAGSLFQRLTGAREDTILGYRPHWIPGITFCPRE